MTVDGAIWGLTEGRNWSPGQTLDMPALDGLGNSINLSRLTLYSYGLISRTFEYQILEKAIGNNYTIFPKYAWQFAFNKVKECAGKLMVALVLKE